MLQTNTSPDASYLKFIERVVASNQVWGLSQDDAWATSVSNEFEDTEVILFWSEKAYAEACAEEDWKNYTPETISLAEFLENWCVGMYADNFLVGPDWNMHSFGKEIEPLEMALAIVEELEKQHKQINLPRYESLKDFKEQLIDAIKKDQ